MVEILDRTSREVLDAKKQALREGGEFGKDVMSVLREFRLYLK